MWYNSTVLLISIKLKATAGHRKRRCLSLCSGGGSGVCTSHASWDRSHVGSPSPSPPNRHQTWGLTTSPTGTASHYWHLVVATETRTVCKRAVCILLKCCLVVLCTQTLSVFWRRIYDLRDGTTNLTISLAQIIVIVTISCHVNAECFQGFEDCVWLYCNNSFR